MYTSRGTDLRPEGTKSSRFCCLTVCNRSEHLNNTLHKTLLTRGNNYLTAFGSAASAGGAGEHSKRATLPSLLGSTGARGAFEGRGVLNLVRKPMTLEVGKEVVLDEVSRGASARGPDGSFCVSCTDGSSWLEKAPEPSRDKTNLEQRCPSRDLVDDAGDDEMQVSK